MVGRMTHRVIILALISVLLSCLLSTVYGGDGTQAALERAVLAAEPVVRAIAERGPAALFDRETRVELTALDGQSTLFAMLGAWSKLSIGRLGLLKLEVAARLPWLIVTGIAPAALYAIVARSWRSMPAGLAVLWLIALPGWVEASVSASDAATLAGAYLVTFALYLASLPRWRGQRSSHPQTWTAMCAVSVAIGLAMSRAMLGVLLLLYVDFTLRNRAQAQRAEERGLFMMPSALACSLAAAPIAFVALNPALYGVAPSVIVAAAFAPIDVRSFSLWQFMLPALAVAGAWLSRSVCLKFAPPRFATLAQCAVIAIVLATRFVT
jgi:hypothetical protein